MASSTSSPVRRLLHLSIPLLGLIVGVLYGGWSYHLHKFPFDGSIPGLASGAIRNTKARFKPPNVHKRTQQTESTELQDLGYAEGTEAAADKTGVVNYVPEIASDGVNLYVSAHGEEAVLMDMEGEVLHRWTYDLSADLDPADAKVLKTRFRKAHLYPDGGLAVVYGGHAWLARLDKDSKLLWKVKGGFHHDLEIQPDGTIFAIGSASHVVERINKKKPVIEDFIVQLSADGEELQRLPVLEAIENSIYAPLLQQMPAYGDIFHTNAIEVLKSPHANAPETWEAGQVLISIREMDVLAVIDMEQRKVVWAMTGMWDGQHQPAILDNGNMLVFDNFGTGMSNVYEFQPGSQNIVWAYQGTAANDFYSETCGSLQRLPNGNTLITESDSGRAFEITADGAEAWRFVNPHTVGDDGEMVATLFEVLRFPKEYVASWLK